MTTQDLFDLAEAMRKVLVRLEALQVDSCGRPSTGRLELEPLARRMQEISVDPEGQEILDFAWELEDLADELHYLLNRDVQFTP